MWWGCARGTRVAVVVGWCGYMGYGMRVRAGGDWLAGRCGVVGCVGARTGENGGESVFGVWEVGGLEAGGGVVDPACACSGGA